MCLCVLFLFSWNNGQEMSKQRKKRPTKPRNIYNCNGFDSIRFNSIEMLLIWKQLRFFFLHFSSFFFVIIESILCFGVASKEAIFTEKWTWTNDVNRRKSLWFWFEFSSNNHNHKFSLPIICNFTLKLTQ